MGGAAATNGVALGDTEVESALQSVDPDLAKVLGSYGRADHIEQGGFLKVRVGSRTKRLPVSRVGVRVQNQDSFVQSFESLTTLSERVAVEGNTASLARGGTYFVIENHVA